jgi:hypothetical protein
MFELIAAAALAATPVPPKPLIAQPPADLPAACKPNGRYQVDWREPALAVRQPDARVQRLGELPKPNHEKTVLRAIGPCAAPLVVGYAVGR